MAEIIGKQTRSIDVAQGYLQASEAVLNKNNNKNNSKTGFNAVPCSRIVTH